MPWALFYPADYSIGAASLGYQYVFKTLRELGAAAGAGGDAAQAGVNFAHGQLPVNIAVGAGELGRIGRAAFVLGDGNGRLTGQEGGLELVVDTSTQIVDRSNLFTMDSQKALFAFEQH